MSGKKFFQIDPENRPNQTTRERVVSERGRKELPPGTKGGENLKPDRHYEHKQHAFDSFCKKVLKCEACNGYREISRRKKHSILNFKTYSKSYKNKKRIDNDRENWVVFQDVHEAIIERAVYEQVQQKRGKIRKRRTNNGEHNMFSGLLVCADCGSNLHFHFNAVWDHTEKLREQYAAELKKVTQLQKQWALRKPVLDAHCLTLQKEILRLEQEVDALVMEKLNGDGGASAHEIGT